MPLTRALPESLPAIPFVKESAQSPSLQQCARSFPRVCAGLMLSYLLEKPSWYCSHSFENLYFEPTLRQCCRLLRGFVSPSAEDAIGLTSPCSLAGTPSASGKAFKVVSLTVEDYAFRPDALERFPWYFFVAACQQSHTKDFLRWREYRHHAGRVTLRHPCYAQGPPMMSHQFHSNL